MRQLQRQAGVLATYVGEITRVSDYQQRETGYCMISCEEEVS